MSEPNGKRVIGGRTYDFSRQVVVMAIVNRTPDSFFDRGATFAADSALRAVERAVDEGAALVGIDSLNIDDIEDPARPVHSALLGADVPIRRCCRPIVTAPCGASQRTWA